MLHLAARREECLELVERDFVGAVGVHTTEGVLEGVDLRLYVDASDRVLVGGDVEEGQHHLTHLLVEPVRANHLHPCQQAVAALVHHLEGLPGDLGVLRLHLAPRLVLLRRHLVNLVVVLVRRDRLVEPLEVARLDARQTRRRRLLLGRRLRKPRRLGRRRLLLFGELGRSQLGGTGRERRLERQLGAVHERAIERALREVEQRAAAHLAQRARRLPRPLSALRVRACAAARAAARALLLEGRDGEARAVRLVPQLGERPDALLCDGVLRLLAARQVEYRVERVAAQRVDLGRARLRELSQLHQQRATAADGDDRAGLRRDERAARKRPAREGAQLERGVGEQTDAERLDARLGQRGERRIRLLSPHRRVRTEEDACGEQPVGLGAAPVLDKQSELRRRADGIQLRP